MKAPMIVHAADGPALLVVILKLLLLTIILTILLCTAGCATITDADGKIVASSKSFGRDLEYSQTIQFFENGSTQSIATTYTTRETVTGFMGAFNEILGTAVAAAQNTF